MSILSQQEIINIQDSHLVGELPVLYSDLRLKHQYRDAFLPSAHQGQRKLLLSELYAVDKLVAHIPTEELIIVYAGSAHGHHLGFLSSMLPGAKFILFDTNPHVINLGDEAEGVHLSRPEVFEYITIDENFIDTIDSTDKTFYIHRGYFTDESAKILSPLKDRIIFFSDIRRNSENKAVVEDIYSQEKWRILMGKPASFFKYRALFPQSKELVLPRTITRSKYLVNNTPINKGAELYLQPWTETKSTETRLILPSGYESWLDESYDISEKHVEWIDNTEYEQKMFAHNIYRGTVVILTSDQITEDLVHEGLSINWDSVREVEILSKYLQPEDMAYGVRRVNSFTSADSKQIGKINRLFRNMSYKEYSSFYRFYKKFLR